VQQARLGAKVRLPGDVFSAEVEGELAGRPRLKDAYAQARGRIFTARAGQFRVPGSPSRRSRPGACPWSTGGC
jgi:hypothetical protein